MKIDYKKELEVASRSMILIHDPQVLIKLIIRTIVQKVRVSHSGILLYHKDKDTYILTVSRGAKGLKVPAGFARLDKDNPLIRFFAEGHYKEIFNDTILDIGKLRNTLRRKSLRKKDLRLLKKTAYQMGIFAAVACIPIFFRDSLLGILLLGQKQNRGKLKQDELDFLSALTSDVAMAIRNAQLFEELQLELDKHRKLFMHTTVALSAAVDAKDHYTHGHVSRVTDYSMLIAKELKKQLNLDDKFMENLQISGLLHDIGKIGIPENVLNKCSKLSDEEMAIIKQHPVIGVTILEPIKELKDCLPAIKYHHERYDGAGYPEGLQGKQIPLAASIISVADSFDAITTDRPYRKGLTKPEALQELQRFAGSQFDPEIVKVAQSVLLNENIANNFNSQK